MTTALNSTINVIISAENAQTVVSLLLSNHISFTLTFSTCLEQHNNNALPTQQKYIDHDEVIKRLSSKTDTIQAIYQKYLVEGITQVPPTESQIAAEVGIPQLKFKNAFKAIYGKPFYQLYMEKRMEYAAQLLLKGYRANEVCTMIGYGGNSSIKFNKMFQKYYGMTPKKYQMKYKPALG